MATASALPAPVRLADLFPPEAIRVGLEKQSKIAVIEALVHHAVALGYLRSQEGRYIIDKILAREDLASSALGHGLALPHCQCESIDRFVGVAGLLHHAIPFDAADCEPVDGVFLTLTPADNPEQSFDVLGRLVTIARNKSLRLLLRGCRTSAQVSELLNEIDQPVVGRLDELARVSLTRFDRAPGDPWSDLAYFSLKRVDRPARDREDWSVAEPRWL